MKKVIEAINKASIKFLEPLSPEETYAIVVEEAIGLVGGDDGYLLLEKSGKLQNVYGSSLISKDVKVRKKGFSYSVFKKGEPLTQKLSDIKRDHPEIIKSGVKSTVLIPLSYKNESVGVITIRIYSNKCFKNENPNILKLFGSMASIVIRKAQLYEESRKSIELRDLFISIAAHELRTPITTIHGYVQLLQGKSVKLPAREKRWIDHLSSETKRLIELIHELLEVNRIKTGKFNYALRECSLKEIVNYSLANFYFSYPKRKIHYSDKLKKSKGMIVGDSNKLQQAFINLLDNAAKFSENDKDIYLSLSSNDRYFIVTIKDYGIGISRDDLPKVLGGFYKKTSEAEQGMGLGLFLVKNIIDLHRGSLEIQSKIKDGTLIEVKLPKLIR